MLFCTVTISVIFLFLWPCQESSKIYDNLKKAGSKPLIIIIIFNLLECNKYNYTKSNSSNYSKTLNGRGANETQGTMFCIKID